MARCPPRTDRYGATAVRCPALLTGDVRCDRRQRRNDDVADGLEALRGDVLQIVGRRVPVRRVVEIDDVDRRNADLEELEVVVLDRRGLVEELRPLQVLR